MQARPIFDGGRLSIADSTWIYCAAFVYDVVMMYSQESTYGTHVHENREVREARFTG